MRVRRASEADAEPVAVLRDKAIRWLGERGSDQWQTPWPDAAAAEERTLAALRQGTTWIAERDRHVVATLTLDSYADPRLWTPDERAEPARYLHRLIVDRDQSGQRIGAELLDWCADQAAREHARWVRVDVWTANLGLHHYYATHGFDHVRTLHLPDYPSGALFQRRAKLLTNA